MKKHNYEVHKPIQYGNTIAISPNVVDLIFDTLQNSKRIANNVDSDYPQETDLSDDVQIEYWITSDRMRLLSLVDMFPSHLVLVSHNPGPQYQR